MAYRIALCDDQPQALSLLSALAREWGKVRGFALQLVCFQGAEALLFQLSDESYDILLLDIEMPGMDGVSLARKVRREDGNVQIIFVTGYSDYIAQGYEVEALHYLMKPVDREKLFSVLDRAVEKLRKNERPLLLELAGETVRLPLRELRYLEVRRNFVTLHAREEYTVKKPLTEFEERLDERFFRTGRSFIVNLMYIQKITRTDIFLTTGEVLPLPRGQYEALNRALIALS